MDRNKKLIIFGLAWVSALLLSWYVHVSVRAPRAERRITVLAAARDLPLGTQVSKHDLKPMGLLERDLPKGAVTQEREAVGRALLFPVGTNEPFTAAKLTALSGAEGLPATIEPGRRAVSVQITDASGVAGLVQPNARVDVLFTRPGNMAEAITTTILQDVRVLSIGRTAQTGQTVDARAPRSPVATLVLTPEETQRLELAKNQGRISLALRNPLDRSVSANNGPITTEALDPMASARLARARRGRTTNLRGKPNLDDPKVWEELTGERKNRPEAVKKEPEKPRAVVDVYRGDKHVQEIFR
jgi:pilus assembly protein CpaB